MYSAVLSNIAPFKLQLSQWAEFVMFIANMVFLTESRFLQYVSVV